MGLEKKYTHPQLKHEFENAYLRVVPAFVADGIVYSMEVFPSKEAADAGGKPMYRTRQLKIGTEPRKENPTGRPSHEEILKHLERARENDVSRGVVISDEEFAAKVASVEAVNGTFTVPSLTQLFGADVVDQIKAAGYSVSKSLLAEFHDSKDVIEEELAEEGGKKN